MKWFPWISRERYDEMKADLTKEIDALKAERITLLDHIQSISIGKPIFKVPTPTNIVEAKSEHTDRPENREAQLIREARAHGFTSPRAIAQYIHNKNIEEADERRRQEAIRSFEMARDEGRAAAQTQESNA